MTQTLLSICINTRNRAHFLIETLDSILEQILSNIEIVVVDGASEDITCEVMQKYVSNHSFIKYVRSDLPIGIDEGYDLAISESSGLYCWMLPDDDLVAEGALTKIAGNLNANYDLIILNLACYTKDFKLNLDQQLFNFANNKIYQKNELNQFFSDLGFGLSYIGCVVIKRNIWFESDRTQYYGSYFVHVGVIGTSTQIDKIIFIQEPLIKYRSANSSWTPRSFEIWYFKWPDLIWSFDKLSDEVKSKVVIRKPWERGLTLLKSRAMGEYDYQIFNKKISQIESGMRRLIPNIISILPVAPLSLALLIMCSIFKRKGLYTIYNLIVSAPYPRLARFVVLILGLNIPFPNKLTKYKD
jgi:abequosyltransferase